MHSREAKKLSTSTVMEKASNKNTFLAKGRQGKCFKITSTVLRWTSLLSFFYWVTQNWHQTYKGCIHYFWTIPKLLTLEEKLAFKVGFSRCKVARDFSMTSANFKLPWRRKAFSLRLLIGCSWGELSDDTVQWLCLSFPAYKRCRVVEKKRESRTR